MKKLAIALLTFIFILSLSACLNDPFEADATQTPTAQVTKKPSKEKPTNKPTQEKTTTPTNKPTQEPTDTPSPAPTPAPTATPLAPTDTLVSGTKVYAFGGGQGTLSFDLDGDGTNDTIAYEFIGQSGTVPGGTINLSTPFLNMMNYEIYQCNLEINGQPLIIQGEVMAGLILIGDINNTDSQYEIMIPEFGPSDDPQTTFVSFNGAVPINIGKLYQNPLMDLKVDGNKFITGQKRGEKLHTWFYNARYRLAASGLIKEVKKDGLVMMDTQVTALIDLPLKISPTDSTIAYTLTTGENATITWTDDDTWFCIENGAGLKGWFAITGFFDIDGMAAPSVFDGLSMAD